MFSLFVLSGPVLTGHGATYTFSFACASFGVQTIRGLTINNIHRKTHLLRSNDYLNIQDFVPDRTPRRISRAPRWRTAEAVSDANIERALVDFLLRSAKRPYADTTVSIPSVETFLLSDSTMDGKTSAARRPTACPSQRKIICPDLREPVHGLHGDDADESL